MYWFPMINFGIKEIYFVSKNNKEVFQTRNLGIFCYIIVISIEPGGIGYLFCIIIDGFMFFFSFTYIKKLIHGPSLYRPNIADQHKVGFFTLDRCSQTEVTEVVDLKEMTEVLQILLQVMLVSSAISVLNNQCPHYPVSSTSRLNVLMNIVYNTMHCIQQPLTSTTNMFSTTNVLYTYFPISVLI